MRRLVLFTLCSVVLATCLFFFKRKDPSTIAMREGSVVPTKWWSVLSHPRTPKEDVRPGDQTFLTFPEWFLVFSPEEQADYYLHHTSSTFPFMCHTAQFWESYHIVNEQIKGHFPSNVGYHVMIWVIGLSTTVEYSIKAWYETAVGRITDTDEPLTEEDQFNARFTQEYVSFIKDRPWYEFDFKSRLKALWGTVPFWGRHEGRKMERRYILTSELLVKYLYGKLIGLGTKQVYEVALPTTAVVVDQDSVYQLPRYDQFATAATELAKNGHSFREIAGNNTAILLTVLVPQDRTIQMENIRTVFVQPITSQPSIKRIALVTPVTQLSSVLVRLDGEKIPVEHVFDY